MLRFVTCLLSLTLWIPTLSHAQNAPAQRTDIAITNARLVTVSDGIIENGTLVIRADTIAALGSDVEIPDDVTTRHDAEGHAVYPGFIDSGTRLGLVEVSSLSETQDYDEIGDLTPHMDALTAVNPNSVAIPVTRVDGVTTVIAEPSGGQWPGQAALIDLIGYTPEQMHVDGVRYMVLNFPSTGRRGTSDTRSEDEIEEEAQEALDELNTLWDDATLYATIQSRTGEAGHLPEYAPAYDALVPVVTGEQPIMLKVDKADDILDALEWAEEREILDQIVLSGVSEGWRVADAIADADVPVLTGPVIALPTRASDRYDAPYANASRLHDAGVTVALRTGEASNVRNLPFHAGFAAAHGLNPEAALEAITLTPARIFGVDDQLGSLEVGKQATLFVADGDPFEPATQITRLFINGYDVPLESRHTDLYDEFLNRSPGLEK
ncbi:MAG: amidohydrolase family protein [Longimonas sp.]|uniref:amidohydrolase family protein n=1 Tax=Longimonas sp. TaxID=2039626 RepID=UPI003975F9F6